MLLDQESRVAHTLETGAGKLERALNQSGHKIRERETLTSATTTTTMAKFQVD